MGISKRRMLKTRQIQRPNTSTPNRQMKVNICEKTDKAKENQREKRCPGQG